MSRLKHKLLKIAKRAMFTSLAAITLVAPTMVLTTPVSAATTDKCPDGFTVRFNTPEQFTAACANHQTGTNTDDQQSLNPQISGNCATAKDACNCSNDHLTVDNCGIVYYLWVIINTLSVLTGIVLVISLIAAGIQWSSAGDNPQQLSAAKTRIFNMIVALVLFVFTYALLQWLVPGGIF